MGSNTGGVITADWADPSIGIAAAEGWLMAFRTDHFIHKGQLLFFYFSSTDILEFLLNYVFSIEK
jgi:hypothetical protein